MKQKEFKLLMLMVLTLAFVFVTAQAQAPVIAKANIPFSFMVEDTMCPPGMYSFEKVGTNELSIYNQKINVRVSILTDPITSESEAPNSELVFNEYKDKDFLSKIWIEGKDSGYYVPITRSEREMMKMGPPKVKKVKCF